MTKRGQLLLLTGPAGAGKSAVAEAWCRRRVKALHMQLDDIRLLVVSGYADPQEQGKAQSEQYDLAAVACLLVARHYVEHGYDVVIDDVFPPQLFQRLWRPRLDGLTWRVVVLQPSLEETLRRGQVRSKRVKQSIVVDQHAAMRLWPQEVIIDTTNLSPEEVVDTIERELGLPEGDTSTLED
ncbi:MAG TPA: AAA family ATPase [Dehalococcoidia bacterium]|nr:AAA family ATPase [Dehalococcoidia bacterium]